MTKELLKTILAGILVGIALFIMPHFMLRILVIFALFKMAAHLLGFGGWRRHHERFHNMTDEQKEAFRKRFGSRGFCTPRDPDFPEQENKNL